MKDRLSFSRPPSLSRHLIHFQNCAAEPTRSNGQLHMRTGFYSDVILCKRLLSHARRHRWRLAGIVLLSLLGPACSLLYPLPLKIAVDSFLGSHPIPWLLAALLPDSMAHSQTADLILAAC